MKIAILVNLFAPKWLAGTEIATYNIAKQLAQRGHEISVITSHDQGLRITSQEDGFRVYRIEWPKIRVIGVLTFWCNMVLTIKRINPDIILAQTLLMGFPALLAKLILHIPYIVWGRGSDVYQPIKIIRLIIRYLFQYADGIIALTPTMQEKMEKSTSKKIFIIPNGIDLSDPITKNKTPPSNISTKKIIYVGRLHPIKGVEYLIMAMKFIHDEMPNVELILVGDGEEREYLKALSNDLGIGQYINFIGQIPNKEVQEHMHCADLFALPSLSEGFPNVLLEAMACGLPIIASRIGGIPDIIEEGINGYLVEPRNHLLLATKIVETLQNGEKIAILSNNNREKVKDYRYERVIGLLEDVLKRVVNN